MKAPSNVSLNRYRDGPVSDRSPRSGAEHYVKSVNTDREASQQGRPTPRFGPIQQQNRY